MFLQVAGSAIQFSWEVLDLFYTERLDILISVEIIAVVLLLHFCRHGCMICFLILLDLVPVSLQEQLLGLARCALVPFEDLLFV